MSILIKNMEMPRNCGECPIYEHLSIHKNTFRFCRLTRMETNPIERRDDCPLISIQPHGRLIDADALKIVDGWIAELRGHSNVQFVYANDIINAPTIIEAEVDE